MYICKAYKNRSMQNEVQMYQNLKKNENYDKSLRYIFFEKNICIYISSRRGIKI